MINVTNISANTIVLGELQYVLKPGKTVSLTDLDYQNLFKEIEALKKLGLLYVKSAPIMSFNFCEWLPGLYYEFGDGTFGYRHDYVQLSTNEGEPSLCSITKWISRCFGHILNFDVARQIQAEINFGPVDVSSASNCFYTGSPSSCGFGFIFTPDKIRGHSNRLMYGGTETYVDIMNRGMGEDYYLNAIFIPNDKVIFFVQEGVSSYFGMIDTVTSIPQKGEWDFANRLFTLSVFSQSVSAWASVSLVSVNIG